MHAMGHRARWEAAPSVNLEGLHESSARPQPFLRPNPDAPLTGPTQQAADFITCLLDSTVKAQASCQPAAAE